LNDNEADACHGVVVAEEAREWFESLLLIVRDDADAVILYKNFTEDKEVYEGVVAWFPWVASVRGFSSA
jgi:hypothetical protein